MIETILKSAKVPSRPARFPDPPKSTFAVYFDEVEASGPDGYNLLLTHFCTIELYEPTPDPTAEAAVEAELDARGIPWTKQARYWLESVKLYQVIYEFTHIEKRRN